MANLIATGRFRYIWIFKDQVYNPLLLKSPELKPQISTALGLMDVNILENIWQEIILRLLVYKVTKGSHIEHLLKRQTLCVSLCYNHV